MGSRRMNDTVNSVIESIRAQNYQSLCRLEQSADEARKWLEQAFEAHRQQMNDPRCENKQVGEKSPLKKKLKIEADSTVVEFVKSLRVKELSTMLRERGLDGNGVKKVLQNRLIDVLENEKTDGRSTTNSSGDSADDAEKNAAKPQFEDSATEGSDKGIPMEVEEESKVELTELNNKSVPNADPSPQTRSLSPLNFVKSALKALSPTKQPKSVTTLIQKIESSNQAREDQTVATALSRDDESHIKATSEVRTLVTEPAANKTSGKTKSPESKNVHPSNSSSKLSSTKSFKATRHAKLEEMRSKSKPVVASDSSMSSVPALSKVKSYAEFAKFSATDGKKNQLAAQMREKANALLQAQQIAVPIQSSKENIINKMGQFQSAGGSNFSSLSKPREESAKTGPGLATAVEVLGESTKSNQELASSSKATEESAKSIHYLSSSNALKSSMKATPVQKEETPSSVKSNLSTVLSPMDTYELSDKDQSDSESEDEGQGKSTKRIPEWAQKAKLVPALENQFNKKLHDPDEIFGEVHTCDLQQIFDGKKARYQRRTSSGNWTQDRVTAAEKLAYKRNGYVES